MLDEAAEFRLELDVDWLIDRDDRTMRKQMYLFLGVVAILAAIVRIVVSGPLYGVAAGTVLLALLFAVCERAVRECSSHPNTVTAVSRTLYASFDSQQP
ncbi:hypothetical protein [Natrinema limicola]|uniref:Uncharacterized protein n=1 Tax=Natrinema limicola JCM 13563 TaxID=1230457 RepID=M0CR97_9EURY|nr:hypothetical protein [Natrinema limicola]ELZ25158.1 hypothetical protein C476_01922 [Natrinema limicola JCM 13563]